MKKSTYAIIAAPFILLIMIMAVITYISGEYYPNNNTLVFDGAQTEITENCTSINSLTINVIYNQEIPFDYNDSSLVKVNLSANPGSNAAKLNICRELAELTELKINGDDATLTLDFNKLNAKSLQEKYSYMSVANAIKLSLPSIPVKITTEGNRSQLIIAEQQIDDLQICYDNTCSILFKKSNIANLAVTPHKTNGDLIITLTDSDISNLTLQTNHGLDQKLNGDGLSNIAVLTVEKGENPADYNCSDPRITVSNVSIERMNNRYGSLNFGSNTTWDGLYTTSD